MMILRRMFRRDPPININAQWLTYQFSELRKEASFRFQCLKILDQRMMLMQSALDSLRDEVARLTDIPASIDAAFAGLKAQLADAIANAGDPAAVNAIVADLHAKIDAVAAAVPANT